MQFALLLSTTCDHHHRERDKLQRRDIANRTAHTYLGDFDDLDGDLSRSL
jgi:hypothetical protein